MTIMAATFEEGDPTLTQVNGASYGLYISTNSGTSFKLVQPTCGLAPGPAVFPLGPSPRWLPIRQIRHTRRSMRLSRHQPPRRRPPSRAYTVTTDSGLIWSPVHVDGKTDLNVIGYNGSVGAQACGRAERLARDRRRRRQLRYADRPVSVAERIGAEPFMVGSCGAADEPGWRCGLQTRYGDRSEQHEDRLRLW